MISLYSGTPGSGKSLHAMQTIRLKLTHNRNVIANFAIHEDKIKCKKNKRGIFHYLRNEQFNVEFFYKWAKDHHVKGIEGQTTIVIDECQFLFNPRDFRDSGRKEFCNFFTIHRHLGYNVILITQNDRLIDRQIRCLIEFEFKHRKANNYKILSILPFKTFVTVKFWYALREKLEVGFFVYKKEDGDLYDSYSMFSLIDDLNKIPKNPIPCDIRYYRIRDEYKKKQKEIQKLINVFGGVLYEKEKILCNS